MKTDDCFAWIKKGREGLLFCGLLLWIPTTTSAAPILYEFSGSVTEINEILPSTVGVGDAFSGQLSYDPDSPFVIPGPDLAFTDVFDFSLTVNGIAFEHGVPGNVLATEAGSGGINLHSPIDGMFVPFSLDGITVDDLFLTFGFSGFPFTLPLPDELPLENFTGGEMTVAGNGSTVGSFSMIVGEITGLLKKDSVAVSEPGSFALMLLSLIGIGLMGWTKAASAHGANL